MTRTMKFSSILVLLLAFAGGCSSADAQCAGGRCASVGFWSPWIGGYYYSSPCAGGRCAVKKAGKPAAAEESNSGKADNAAAAPANPGSGADAHAESAANEPLGRAEPSPGVIANPGSGADAHAESAANEPLDRAEPSPGVIANPGSGADAHAESAANEPLGLGRNVAGPILPAADSRPGETPRPVEFKPFCLRVAELVNAQRKALGLSALELDETLCAGCDSHSRYMASYGFVHAYGIGARECIASGAASPESVVNMWLNSSGHRAILLGPGRIVGIGRSGSFWTLRVR